MADKPEPQKPTPAKTQTEQPKPEQSTPEPTLTSEDRRQLAMAISTTKTGVMDPVEYAQMKKIAADMIASKSLPSTFTNAAQVQMALVAGREMGMTTMEALNDLYFVGGRLQIYGKATPAAIRRAGWRIAFKDEPDACTATISNPETGEEITDTFTFKDAELSGFVKDARGGVKIGWREGANRKRKLRYAVLSQIIHTYIPEVLGAVAGIGDYSEDYMDADKMDKAYREQEAEEKRAEKLARLKQMDEPEPKPAPEPQDAEIEEAEVVEDANN